MKPRVMLLSSVHPARDPRIFYKIIPALAGDYEVYCALPAARAEAAPDYRMISIPFRQKLWKRLFVSHPLLLWHFLRIRPAIVHIFVPELIPLALFFQWFGAKVIYEVQENLYKKFEIKKINNALIFKYLFKRFDQLARRRFYFIFTEKAYLDEYSNLHYPHVLIRNFVSMPFLQKPFYKNIDTKPEFLYLGTISAERCLDTMIAAFAKFKAIYPDFVAHFFGTVRVSTDTLRQMEGYSEVRGHLVFHGYTDQRLVMNKIGRPLAGLALLKPVADYPDSYTTKMFEYMAMGIPVITSDFPLYRDVVEQSECGFCISPYDADLLCRTLIWLAENPEKAWELGMNGKKQAVERYNWKLEEKVLLEFYANISNVTG